MAFERSGIQAEVEPTEWKFYYRAKRTLLRTPHVTILLHLEDTDEETLEFLVRLCRDRTYPDSDIILVYGGDASVINEFCIQREEELSDLSLLLPEDQSSCSDLFNRAVEYAKGEYLLFLSSDVRPRNQDWIECLLEIGLQKEIGLVGGRLHPENGVEVISKVPDVHSDSPFYYCQFLLNSSVHMNGLQWTQEVLAVSLKMCLVRKKLFVSANGLNAEEFPSLFAGADLGYRLRERGYINIYTPYSAAEWLSGRVRVAEQQAKDAWTTERISFQARWKDMLADGDPYYHHGCYRDSGISYEAFWRWYTGA
jgi:cellulose synthase/poly-beta-1,6-N-acetylglucosamine synthase-like glycosyltransferase